MARILQYIKSDEIGLESKMSLNLFKKLHKEIMDHALDSSLECSEALAICCTLLCVIAESGEKEAGRDIKFEDVLDVLLVSWNSMKKFGEKNSADLSIEQCHLT